MTQKEIIAYNERLAIEKIRAAYAAGDLTEAMQIVHNTMGVDDMKAATPMQAQTGCGDTER